MIAPAKTAPDDRRDRARGIGGECRRSPEGCRWSRCLPLKSSVAHRRRSASPRSSGWSACRAPCCSHRPARRASGDLERNRCRRRRHSPARRRWSLGRLTSRTRSARNITSVLLVIVAVVAVVRGDRGRLRQIPRSSVLAKRAVSRQFERTAIDEDCARTGRVDRPARRVGRERVCRRQPPCRPE